VVKKNVTSKFLFIVPLQNACFSVGHPILFTLVRTGLFTQTFLLVAVHLTSPLCCTHHQYAIKRASPGLDSLPILFLPVAAQSSTPSHYPSPTSYYPAQILSHLYSIPIHMPPSQCHSLYPEDRGSIAHQNTGILPHYCSVITKITTT
jgi:hypothetical protein